MRISNSVVANILNAASLSGVIDIEAYKVIGFMMPAAWTTANLTFLGSDSPDPTTMQSIFDQTGTEFLVNAAASRAISVLPTASAFLPFRYIQIRSGTTAVPVAQGANRAIKVVMADSEFEQ